MVFSFFKKQNEKMPERAAAKPRSVAEPARPDKAPVKGKAAVPPPPAVEEKKPREPLPDLEFTSAQTGAGQAAQSKPQEVFEDEFSDWSLVEGINVQDDVDPIDSCAEQVAVMFANGQDAASRSLLDTFLQSYPGAEGKRFWMMQFDLLQVMGDRASFDKLGVDFVHAFETSPPTWHGYSATGAAAPVRAHGPRKLYLQGVLTGDNMQPVSEIATLVEQKAAVMIDCAKLVGCDDEVAEALGGLLQKARKAKLPVSLVEIDGFLKRLNERAVVGESGHEPVWRLLLEILQRHGTQETFEERAVDYAVTFELSPPSWEVPAVQEVVESVEVTPSDDAHYLHGDLKNCRFDDLGAVLEGSPHPIFDFSDVTRLDFISAGQLVNRLAPYKAQGKEIVIRGPNRLVAELMAVVGLDKQARIIVHKSS